jgi:nitrite reductase/ring-hydroxylating ferredoxin subunit
MEKGRVEDGKIACPWHRSSFDLCTGEVVEWITWPPLANRAMAILAKEKALPVFPVRVEEGSIWVDVNYRSTSDSSS